ncbi:hypothetical protein VW23_007900 [Devosia insulae DS-56]|uniref:Uncharacterized protein n=1 Tax=Devosia insulae DS-56 TaxID=1116389 RepID=A0A1E5XX56_9HYPH|nr:hypothetical protein [Devosia insulae]OEO33171.1 hypothetical protein VW23_007900 [Devosia insulae DS-56]
MPDPAGWTVTPNFPQLVFGTLVVSFQRFVLPAAGLPEGDPPQSLGALPVAMVERRFVLPVDADEAFWIGLWDEAGMALRLRLTPVPGDGYGVKEQFLLPHALTIPGWRREGEAGLLPFTRTGPAASVSLARLLLIAEVGHYAPAGATVELVDYPTYATLSGQPAPDKLDPEAGYKGYLLP